MFGNFTRYSLELLSGRNSFHFWWKNGSMRDELKTLYKEKLLPLEERHLFHEFHSPKYNDSDFDAKPFILLMGQYSTGKTTLIRYLLGSDFPGMRIGPEPTTDKFIAIMFDEKSRVIPGNALVMDSKKPFGPLARYGNTFLARFQCSTLNNPVLEYLSLIDTPGILSGEKQRVDRGYDFTGVLHWFAERVDRIILLFDAHKLDISDEFKLSIEALRGQNDKILILLNKADMVDHQSLMRIYGSLMWSLEKVFNTPEVPKVHVGSFWDKSLKNSVNRQLFEDEEIDLLKDIQGLPKNAVIRLLNDLSKRARLARVHAYIIDSLKRNMPSLFGKEQQKMKLIENLESLFSQLQKDLDIPEGDFPEVKMMQEKLKNSEFSRFNTIDEKMLKSIDELLTTDITNIMTDMSDDTMENLHFKVGAMSRLGDNKTPFSYKIDEGFNAGKDESIWIIEKFRKQYDKLFNDLGPDENGKLKRSIVKGEFLKTDLPNNILSKIYTLADIDDDGLLDIDEFALANYIIDLTLKGYDVPDTIPIHLIPPSKKNLA